MDGPGELGQKHADGRHPRDRTWLPPATPAVDWAARPSRHEPAPFDETVCHGPTTAVYAALDECGQRVLDALEERLLAWGLGIKLEAHTRRRRLYSGTGLTMEPSALDRQLSALDPSWHEHVVRLV